VSVQVLDITFYCFQFRFESSRGLFERPLGVLYELLIGHLRSSLFSRGSFSFRHGITFRFTQSAQNRVAMSIRSPVNWLGFDS